MSVANSTPWIGYPSLWQSLRSYRIQSSLVLRSHLQGRGMSMRSRQRKAILHIINLNPHGLCLCGNQNGRAECRSTVDDGDHSSAAIKRHPYTLSSCISLTAKEKNRDLRTNAIAPAHRPRGCRSGDGYEGSETGASSLQFHPATRYTRRNETRHAT